MGRGLTSRGQGSGSVFSAKYRLISATSSPLVPKVKRSCFSQGERSALLILHLPSGSRTLNWHLAIEVYVLGYTCNSQGCEVFFVNTCEQ